MFNYPDITPADLDLPEIVQLGHYRRHTRKERKLSCGHTVPKGTFYEEWVGLVDGEFTVDHVCNVCLLEMEGIAYG